MWGSDQLASMQIPKDTKDYLLSVDKVHLFNVLTKRNCTFTITASKFEADCYLGSLKFYLNLNNVLLFIQMQGRKKYNIVVEVV